MTSTEGYADKIDKLLRKAESTTPAEAEALRDKAYALMTKYAIDQAEIDARRAASGGARIVEKIVERSVDITGIFRFGLLEVVHNVTMAFESVNAYMIKDFRVKVEKADGNFRWASAVRYYIVGFESDVKQILLMVTSLQLQAAAEMVHWWNADPAHKTWERGFSFRSKRQFIISFGKGAGQKIRLSARRARAGASSGAELVLYDKRQEVDQYMSNMSLKASKSRLQNGSMDASRSGYDAGQRANTGDTGLGGDRKKRINS